MMRLMHMDNPI